MSNLTPQAILVIINLAALVFAAGGAYGLFKRQQKDLNGLGRKLNEMQAAHKETSTRTELLMLYTCPADKRESLLEKLLFG